MTSTNKQLRRRIERLEGVLRTLLEATNLDAKFTDLEQHLAVWRGAHFAAKNVLDEKIE